jgi:hypothetical protein
LEIDTIVSPENNAMKTTGKIVEKNGGKTCKQLRENLQTIA